MMYLSQQFPKVSFEEVLKAEACYNTLVIGGVWLGGGWCPDCTRFVFEALFQSRGYFLRFVLKAPLRCSELRPAVVIKCEPKLK